MAVTRRGFLQWSSLTGAALMLGITRDDRVFALPPDGLPPTTTPFEPNQWLRIDASGLVTIVAAKSEMGQGVRTALPMIVAEELGADWARVRVEHAKPGATFPDMRTSGSGSVSGSWRPLRTAAAAAREMLVSAAAARMGRERGRVLDGARRGSAWDERSSARVRLAGGSRIPPSRPRRAALQGELAVPLVRHARGASGQPCDRCRHGHLRARRPRTGNAVRRDCSATCSRRQDRALERERRPSGEWGRGRRGGPVRCCRGRRRTPGQPCAGATRSRSSGTRRRRDGRHCRLHARARRRDGARWKNVRAARGRDGRARERRVAA